MDENTQKYQDDSQRKASMIVRQRSPNSAPAPFQLFTQPLSALTNRNRSVSKLMITDQKPNHALKRDIRAHKHRTVRRKLRASDAMSDVIGVGQYLAPILGRTFLILFSPKNKMYC